MKIKSDMWQVTTKRDKRQVTGAGSNDTARESYSCHPSPVVTRHLERGFALVITLILLSVTLIMAVAFLAISRRERGSVTTSTDTATARLAADAALANAEAQIISSVLATTNPYINNLLVSTNYINAYGFVTGVANPTNVNYDYLSVAGPYTVNDFLQNVANLYYLPRAPVFAVTNQQTGATEFRFYLDLNRNGKFEDSGNDVPNVNNLGFTNGTVPEIGDPQWIGVLERPDAPHGPNNKFLARYAFFAMPADGALDLNFIHNQALNQNLSANDGYFRNQGVASWEINLAAFLTDLNTNEWDTIAAPYNYQEWIQPTPFPNTGFAFEDARALLAYRYNYNPLPWASSLIPNYPLTGPVDIFPFGLAMTSTTVPIYSYNNLDKSWPGADNTNHYFALPSDLFDPTKVENSVTPPGFIERLNQAGNSTNTYDRYTFYRLLSQLGTDSSPESGKMNLNYDNLDPFVPGPNGPVYDTNGVTSVTNFAAWTPLAFFTNAADRMLRMYTTNWFQADPPHYLANYYGFTNTGGYYTNNPGQYFYVDGSGNTINYDQSGFGLTNIPLFGMTNQIPAFGLTNIPVYVNGQYVYSSAVQRVLQLAANIYDATTNAFTVNGFTSGFPSVFRPLISNYGTINLFVSSFTNVVFVNGVNDLQFSPPFDAETIAALWPTRLDNVPDNIYGVPWIIGAKKGFPNFNQFAMESAFQITRKLRLSRGGTDLTAYPPNTYKIDQMFNCSVSNLLQVECWNSYFSNYTRSTTIQVADHIQMVLTNDQPVPQPLWFPLDFNLFATMTTNNWPGIGANFNAGSFLLTSPTNLTAIALPTSTYLFNNTYDGYRFHPVGTNTEPTFEVNPNGLPQPHWWLLATNNLQVVMIDNASGRVIDYLQMRGPKIVRDLTSEILGMTNFASMWQTSNVSSGILQGKSVPSGLEAQLVASERYVASLWGGQDAKQVEYQIDGFLKFVGLTPIYDNTGPYGSTNLEIQAPYTPTATPVQITTWQANDPLVHYLASDLYDSAQGNGLHSQRVNPVITPTPNERYQPWGRSVQMAARTSPDISPWNLALKDPLMWNSDQWDFPTNKFPTVGWLGRVHRGTPWQTAYLKASNVLKEGNGTNTWVNWTGNLNTSDANNAAPVQDRLLFDIFSTAINDNASRGQLSVNVAADTNNPVAGLAAWSAVFSGVVNLSNTIPDVGSAGIMGMNIISAAGTALQTAKLPLPPAYNLTYNALPINPAGANSVSSPLGQLVTNINYIRTQFTNTTSSVGAFKHVGDILAVPAMTEQSPFLHWNNNGVPDTAQQQYGISDEMYEWLPQQTMSLLRASSEPRYVIYSYGQTLKPAPNGVVTSGTDFGMVTNYQVVSETATRAVVQFRQVVVTNSLSPLTLQTNYSTTVEQFNLLPPD
jgi:hypothetical protein